MSFLLLFAVSSYSQEIDIVKYMKIENPLLYASYIGKASGETYVERWDYTENVKYNNATVIQVERKKGPTTPDTSFNKNYYNFNDNNLMVVGVILSLTLQNTVFPVELPFTPSLVIPRFVDLKQKIERSGKSEVKIGIIKVNIQFSVTYEFVSFESVDTPYGHFDRALHIEAVKAMSIPGLTQTLSTSEWYDPDVGLVKMLDKDTQSTIELQAVQRTNSTAVSEWSNF